MLDEAIVSDYRRHREDLAAQCEALRLRLAEVLARRGVLVHLVSGRLKAEASLRRKLSRPDRTYARLWDVTDLVGLRVTTYFEDAIATAAKEIEAAFEVDFGHSTDRRVRDGFRFGYRSVHYVCAAPAPGPLPAAFRFEIQVRTVLQHAWAEVEHDLGYKAQDALPDGLRRRFSRVASLLEIADEEFVSIRRDLEGYARTVEGALADPTRPSPVDVVAIQALARRHEVRELDAAVAAQLGRPLGAETYHPAYLARMLRLSGHATTTDVLASLQRHRADVPALVQPYFAFASEAWRLGPGSIERVLPGYSLFFLAHAAILRGPGLGLSKVAQLTALYRELDYPGDERTAQQVASGLVRALDRAGAPPG